MLLKHPQTASPPPPMEKLSSMKLVPGATKVGGCWFRGLHFGPTVLSFNNSPLLIRLSA